MEIGDLVELVIGLIALLVAGISWLYRRMRRLPPSPSRIYSKQRTPSTPTPPRHPPRRPTRLVVLSTLVSVLVSAILSVFWISFRPGTSPQIDEKLGYLTAFYLCIGGPLIAAFAVFFTSAFGNLFSEFQGKPLPRALHALIGAFLGIILTVPVFLFISTM